MTDGARYKKETIHNDPKDFIGHRIQPARIQKVPEARPADAGRIKPPPNGTTRKSIIGPRAMQRLEELDERRLRSFVPAGFSDPYTPAADVTTEADLDFLDDILISLPPELRLYVRLREQLAKEYANGVRCRVCCMTTNQAKEADYNCAYEC